MKVLVGYESKYGATQGIADRIGEALRQRGFEADVERCGAVRDLAGYDAFVVGSATYAFNWRKDARKFVRDNAPVLSARPTWLFSSGPPQVFRGAYHHEKIRGADRIVAWMPAIRDIMPEGDFREWDAIDAWANSIADDLGATAPTHPPA